MNPNTVITDANIDTPHVSQAAINAELAAMMKESVGDPILSTRGWRYISPTLEELLGDGGDPRAKTLRDAMLVAVHTYASHANDEIFNNDEIINGPEHQPEGRKMQLQRFYFNQATEIYGPVYVSLRNALQAFQRPGYEVDLQPRLKMLTGTLNNMAKNSLFSNDLLVQANIAAAAAASKGFGVD